MADKKTEMTTTGPTSIAVHDYGADEAAGYENQTSRDTKIPFVVLLQALSPQVTQETVDGAKPGMWYNAVTEQLWSRENGFLFLPATTENKVGIWTPRDAGGGFHGHMDVDDPQFLAAMKKSQKFGKYYDADGNQLVDTFYVYGVICSEEGEPETAACIACSSTKITPYKRWQTRLQQLRIRKADGTLQRPPLYAHLTRISSYMDSNDKKQDYYVPKFSSADPRGLKESLLSPDDDRFLAAKSLYEMIRSGMAKVDFAAQNAAGGEDSAPGSAAFG